MYLKVLYWKKIINNTKFTAYLLLGIALLYWSYQQVKHSNVCPISNHCIHHNGNLHILQNKSWFCPPLHINKKSTQYGGTKDFSIIVLVKIILFIFSSRRFLKLQYLSHFCMDFCSNIQGIWNFLNTILVIQKILHTCFSFRSRVIAPLKDFFRALDSGQRLRKC